MQDPVSRLNAALSGRYEIERQLGEGGMATVYLAEDLKHRRRVALKVLKPELAAVVGAERFLAEIRTTANLQHPHILPLFDSGDADGLLFYVMPHVEGESLRARLDREHQLPVDEAVRIATNVAEALDYAHRHGVIHRDIKPANILLLDGKPVIADFGIALAVSHAGGGRLTETGLSLGTPHYMSPEQATGDVSVGPATDVYALGCVLYEMLVGEPPYTGSTPQAVLGKIITAETPSASEARRSVPSHVDAAISKALEKVPADRFSTARVFAESLSSDSSTVGAVPRLAKPALPRAAAVIPWLLSGALVATLAWLLSRPNTAGDVEWWSVVLPEDAPMEFVGEAALGVGRRAFDVSRDGRTIVYIGGTATGTRLFVRESASGAVRPLPGTEGAWAPFLSPDGEAVGFFVGDQLMRMDLDAAEPSVVAETGDASTGSWSDDGRIAVAHHDGSSLLIVDLASGTEQVRTIAESDPVWLPGSEWLLAQCVPNPWHLCALSPESGEQRFLSRSGAAESALSPNTIVGSDPTPAGEDLLLYTAPGGNVIMAVRFDPESLTTSGPHVEVLRGVRREGILYSQQQMAVSSEGRLVFARGLDANFTELVWAGRGGSERPLGFRASQHGPFVLSPNGRRLVLHAISAAGVPQLRLLDLERRTEQAWTGEWTPAGSWSWHPNGRELYATFVDDKIRILRVSADLMNGGELMYEGDVLAFVELVLPDGRLAVNWLGGRARYISLLTESELREAVGPTAPLLPDERGDQLFSSLSPDGRWLTYASNASGRYEIVGRRYPELDRRTQVSFEGGELPTWAPDGSGLYYRDGRRWYWVARRESEAQPFADPVLFTTGDYINVAGPDHAVSAGGDELLVLKDPGPTGTRELVVVTNWLSEVRDRLRRAN
ncbi:MAG TPA: protein kinase [Longimicrobiales bacterium]|nr:protein kinase [Longimicrobiales bacterium]